MAVAALHDQRPLAQAGIGLTQGNAVLPCQSHQPLAGSLHQFGGGRKGNRLLLYGGVHRHPLEVLLPQRPHPVGHGQALLEYLLQTFRPDPVPPPGHRRALHGQLMLKVLFAAEALEVWVVDPALADLLIREIEHMLEDVQPNHQPRRDPRPTLLRIQGFIGLVEESPRDPAPQHHQLVAQVDDVFEPRAEQVLYSR